MTTFWKFFIATIVLAALTGLLIALGMDLYQNGGPTQRRKAYEQTYRPVYIHVDAATGCMYVSYGSGLSPRIAPDGKTHIGCGSPWSP